MIGAPNSLNLNCKVRVMKEAPDFSVSEQIADIFRNYNIDKQRLFVNNNLVLEEFKRIVLFTIEIEKKNTDQTK